ncbi:uncharacterized protein LOC120002019 isoform X3 [Tripterygium wilfordii]|nr:uncharacterized protein LOC120002019 isoform X3 [Tripterygium wilfordii]XP_038706492.1 uncharacterized protein LOC120002019 isoform X3 [Tripterygium wilfordii]XP_038706493.1 uncharacterized protein LOC120002019 isoform X3 [Tripterygium wilfordii]
MSGAPRRSQEEGVHSSSSRHPHEDAGAYPKLTSSVSTECHPPYEVGQDSRAPKVPRADSRDVDRRSPMHSTYRVPASSNDSHMDAHPAGPENRVESRDSNRENRADNRDQRLEPTELHGEAKRESQSARGDNEAKFDSRGNDGKEIQCDRETYNNPKGDGKMEKDGLESATSHLNRKEPKEYHMGNRFSEFPGGKLDHWHNSRGNSQGPTKVEKEGPAAEESDYVESHEAVGENKVDSKGDDRFKDKDRKRKDAKHRELGDRDKERGECKDSSREEREAERRERERKDISKDKERLKEREKDHVKREMWNSVEKENLHDVKEPGNVSVRIAKQENLVSEQKKQKDFESWKNADRDGRKERDFDLEGDRLEKRSRCYDKESDDGCADGEGASERERDVFNYGVQQKKRMLRSRGSPQVANREPRSGACSQENDGSQAAGFSGKSEVSSVIYKIGECMEDLIKLWKEYESAPADKNVEISQNGPPLEIRIPTEYVTAINRQVRGGQLWGTDIYTYDSDLVAVLMHTGYCRPTASPPPGAIQELRAMIRVLPPQDSYTSTLRNNVRSRAWGAAIGCSYRVERCCIVKKAGGAIDLEPCLTHTSTVEPTLAPVAVERTMTTRAAASNVLRQQRFVRDITIQYNLCNEPWIKYSISVVADKGLKKPLYTSARLKKGEVLYLETHSCRYELCFTGEKMVKSAPASQNHEGETEKPPNNHSLAGDKNESENIMIDAFRLSRCKRPLPQKFMRSIGIPLPPEHVEVLADNLDWEDVQWSQTGVWIAGKEYTLARVHFLSMN